MTTGYTRRGNAEVHSDAIHIPRGLVKVEMRQDRGQVCSLCYPSEPWRLDILDGYARWQYSEARVVSADIIHQCEQVRGVSSASATLVRLFLVGV
jgi:hypothetical protein